ncbi:VOC family protein [Arthrobacter sp.]|uniref:VOC family protein n=1 Tax=Arthrobacter sp. TaxID=1667 RepID=UPI003A92F29A
MIRIGAIVLHVSDTDRASAFWSRALGFRAGSHPDFLIPADGAATRLHLDGSDHTHLDLWVDSAAEQASEVERLIRLGATRVDWEYPDGADFVVLADPCGTRFCVVDTGAAPARPGSGPADDSRS